MLPTALPGCGRSWKLATVDAKASSTSSGRRRRALLAPNPILREAVLFTGVIRSQPGVTFSGSKDGSVDAVGARKLISWPGWSIASFHSPIYH